MRGRWDAKQDAAVVRRPVARRLDAVVVSAPRPCGTETGGRYDGGPAARDVFDETRRSARGRFGGPLATSQRPGRMASAVTAGGAAAPGRCSWRWSALWSLTALGLAVLPLVAVADDVVSAERGSSGASAVVEAEALPAAVGFEATPLWVGRDEAADRGRAAGDTRPGTDPDAVSGEGVGLNAARVSSDARDRRHDGRPFDVAYPAVSGLRASPFSLSLSAEQAQSAWGASTRFDDRQEGVRWQSLEGRLDFRPSSFASETGPAYGLGLSARLSLYEARERSRIAGESSRHGSSLAVGPTFEMGRLRSDFSVGVRQEWAGDDPVALAPLAGRLARFGSAGFIDLEGRYALREGRELRLGVFYDAPEWLTPSEDGSEGNATNSARYGLRMGVSF